ncbi:MAG TPA: hypothetical protein VH599_09810 [Ktedonobacterales bacterium]|jgi:hypothetical protein
MYNDQLSVLTNRREAIALFNMLRGRDPRRPWPILPLFVLMAPGGGGKSALMDYLRDHRCCSDGCSALPYASLDFTQPHTPKSILHILVALRNQLQGHTDGSGRNLVFPRFDLGAAIALAAPAIETLPPTNLHELEICLSESVPFFTALHRLKTPLESVVPSIPYLLEGIIWPAELKPLQTILQRLDKEPGWRWYRDCANDSGLHSARSLHDVLLRLQVLSALEGQEREYLIEEILAAALIADLLDGLVTRTNLYCWDKATNAVIFLDGFEALLEKSNNRAYRLLEILALAEQRLSSESDPLLLVIGTRKRLFSDEEEGPDASPEEQAAPLLARRYALRRLQDWLSLLPEDKSAIRLSQLALTLQLPELGARGTRDYLAKLDEQRGTQVFVEEELVSAICQLTYGQPLCLALAAAAALEAEARGHPLDPAELKEALQSDALAFGQADDLLCYLLDLFLRQLPEGERRQFTLCAAPRTLDAATLGAVLQLPSDDEAARQWEHYRSLPFMRSLNAQQITFHPLLRALLLKRLVPQRNPQSDYYQAHSRLRAHFIRFASIADLHPGGLNSEQAQIEAAHHALALGQPELAIALGLAAQQSQSAYWSPLLEAVSQAPGDLMAPETEQRASSAVNRARQNHEIQDTVTALILYRWLLTSDPRNKLHVARIRHKMAVAYSTLPGGERHANLKRAIAYYQAALKVYQAMRMDFDIERAQKSLEIAQDELQSLSNGRGRQRDVISVAPGR